MAGSSSSQKCSRPSVHGPGGPTRPGSGGEGDGEGLEPRDWVQGGEGAPGPRAEGQVPKRLQRRPLAPLLRTAWVLGAGARPAASLLGREGSLLLLDALLACLRAHLVVVVVRRRGQPFCRKSVGLRRGETKDGAQEVGVDEGVGGGGATVGEGTEDGEGGGNAPGVGVPQQLLEALPEVGDQRALEPGGELGVEGQAVQNFARLVSAHRCALESVVQGRPG